MPGILGLIPSWAWRWLAILAIGASLFGYGYLRGYRTEERALELYQAKVETLGKEAAAKVVQIKAEQDKNTKEVRDGYEQELADIDAYYASHPSERVRVVYARGSKLPAAPDCPARADGPASQPATPRGDPDFEKACALDAAKVKAWQDFARKNGFPVR